MTANYLTFETSQNLPQQGSSVTETTNATYAGTFPSAFQTSGSNVMIVMDLNVDGSRSRILTELEFLVKAINQSINFLR